MERIGRLPQAGTLHLVGGSAIGVHFGHRRSEELDIFSLTPDVDLHAVRAALANSVASLVIRGETDVAARRILAARNAVFSAPRAFASDAVFGRPLTPGEKVELATIEAESTSEMVERLAP